ncbi:D-alanine--D-alanine ligase [Candidatus Phaeomarinobacter ectocarpi]|uniref:D-alanine--D-alanine ligase n=1 Tax=Candidatus Phaeomarinibacter ectocarpi TaxID=1458461 RepID=X5MLS8_9HYPH|nr:D-alanine--D-alanine ligase [Candidatus Phaeomarinobacter ectocarpi]CDO58676.1 D-alanine--D-alanine ligase [Candidatus Phaeomarinobacter ectocarpi]
MSRADTHVAVLMGGWSAEREVSLSSGKGCSAALREAGFTVTDVDAGHDLAQVLADLNPDVAFNALHGPWGEDGCVQGLLEVLELPYTHSGVLASALAIDKQRAKHLLANTGMPVAEGRVVTREEAASAHAMDVPYVIKPLDQGSSIGVFIVREGDNRPPAELSDPKWNLGEEMLVEAFVAGREFTCAVIDDMALEVIEIKPRTAFYDYEAKYAAGGSEHLLPAPIDEGLKQRIQDLSLMAHRGLGCRGVSRSDFIFDEKRGEPVFLEVNTQPGMTPTSLVPEIAAYGGMPFPELVAWMVEDASCRR